jgi:SAM-dependent methyltransferase
MTAAVNPNKALWEKGDFSRIAVSMRDSGEALVKEIGIRAGLTVLDIGCGDGTTAVPAARLGAQVLGLDISSKLVAAATRRAHALGLKNLYVQEGDAANLSQIENRTFDHVISIFGAMFSPRPFEVAKEMVRVTKRGGTVTMGNWIPGDPTMVAQLLKISTAYTPPPAEGFVSPMLWGVEANVIERFGAAGVAPSDIALLKDVYTFRFEGTPAEFVDAFRRYYGPTMNAFEAAAKNGKEEDLRRELEALFTAHDTSTKPGVTVIAANFLRVSVTVR